VCTEEGFDEYRDRYLSGMGVPHAVYLDVTSVVCRHACVAMHSDSCCSVVYERANKQVVVVVVVVVVAVVVVVCSSNL